MFHVEHNLFTTKKTFLKIETTQNPFLKSNNNTKSFLNINPNKKRVFSSFFRTNYLFILLIRMSHVPRGT